MKHIVSKSEYYSDFLLKIYKCRVPFELYVIDQHPKTRWGVYICASHRIRIYTHSPSLAETAIHEYAHHIHHTESGGFGGYGRHRTHGEVFWRIYSALCVRAMKLGLYEDPLIADIVCQQD